MSFVVLLMICLMGCSHTKYVEVDPKIEVKDGYVTIDRTRFELLIWRLAECQEKVKRCEEDEKVK